MTLANSSHRNHIVQTRALHAYLRCVTPTPVAANVPASVARRVSAGAADPLQQPPEILTQPGDRFR